MSRRYRKKTVVSTDSQEDNSFSAAEDRRQDFASNVFAAKLLSSIFLFLLISPFIYKAGLSALAQVQSGKASYYSKRLSGRQTASGERLHHDSLTCAHRTYPFGTMLKVTNPANGKEVIVRVTDRGPYIKGRIIDLSVRAARELGIISQGIAPVVVERYNPSIVPFKPEDVIDLPEFDIGTNEGSDTKPIWMELRDQYKKKQQEGKE